MKKLIKAFGGLLLTAGAPYVLFIFTRFTIGDSLFQAIKVANRLMVIWFVTCAVLILLTKLILRKNKNGKHSNSEGLILKIFAALVALFFGLLVCCGYLLATSYSFTTSTLANYSIIVGIIFAMGALSAVAGLGMHLFIKHVK